MVKRTVIFLSVDEHAATVGPFDTPAISSQHGDSFSPTSAQYFLQSLSWLHKKLLSAGRNRSKARASRGKTACVCDVLAARRELSSGVAHLGQQKTDAYGVTYSE